MPLYTWLNLAIIFFPLALSFDRRVAYWRSWPAVALAIIAAGSLFIGWDILVTRDGHWSFDPLLAGDLRILGLPSGEILFFFAMPFACLFILEVARGYLQEKVYHIPMLPLMIAAALAATGAVLARDRGYTFIVLVSLGLTLILIAGPARRLFSRRTTIVAILLSFLPFLIFNGLFTALPIVRYAPAMILGPRVITIPLEDFAYSFSLIALAMMVYDFFGFLRIGGRR
ncbi:MAG: lycopene cyclase domain-containing protein [Spirochaetota bacterium]